VKLLLSCVLATGALVLTTPAHAAPTPSAPLVCDGAAVDVTGFGRGQVLHVVGTEQRFIVTRAETATAGVVFEAPGQAGRDDVVSCSVTSPSGREFLFEGFFTPRP
jgi:hypothetical protein